MTAGASGAIRPRVGAVILAVLALTNLVAYAARNALFAVYPALHTRYDIDDGELGLLQTVFMVPHAAATLVFGWAGDRFDRRRVIAVGVLLASVAGAGGALSESYLGLLVSRAAVGLGTAAVVPVANSILGQVFEGPAKASRLAVFNLGLFLGGVVGFAAGMALGFPLVLLALAVPGAALAAAVWALPVPPASGARAPAPASAGAVSLAGAARAFATDARALLRISTLRWVIASTTVMAFAAGGFNAWLKELLVREKGMTDAAATGLLVLALGGGLAGILVGARVADRLARRAVAGRLWTIAIGMAATAPCAAVAIALPPGWALDAVGVATLFFISWYHAPMAATVDDLAPRGLSVAAQGLVIFTMHMIGTAPSSWVVGELAHRTSIATALWLPTAALLLAAACMVAATRTFARDRARTAVAAVGAGQRPSL